MDDSPIYYLDAGWVIMAVGSLVTVIVAVIAELREAWRRRRSLNARGATTASGRWAP